MKTQSLIFAIIFCISFKIQAAETDNFSTRMLILNDSGDALNFLFNDMFNDVERELSRKGSCSSDQLYKLVWKFLGRDYVGMVERNINSETSLFDRYPIRDKESIYRGLTFVKVPTTVLAPTIRIENLFIGSDKFGHFVTEGHVYFKRFVLEKRSLIDTLSYGVETEGGIYGLKSSGVYTFADLVANFHGLRFWMHLLGTEKDILTDKKVPGMFECRDDRWVRTRSFDWKNYLDEAWDEGVNCSAFASQRIATRVYENIQELNKNWEMKLDCPNNISKTRKNLLIKKYHMFSDHLLNFTPYRVISKDQAFFKLKKNRD